MSLSCLKLSPIFFEIISKSVLQSHSLPSNSTERHILIVPCFSWHFCSESPQKVGCRNKIIHSDYGKTKQKSVADRHCVTVGIWRVRPGKRQCWHSGSNANGNGIFWPGYQIDLCDWCGRGVNRRFRLAHETGHHHEPQQIYFGAIRFG